MSKMRANIVTVGLFGAAALLPLNATKADQVGSASWYALTSTTASGEQMDPSAMTAAHPSLPFGTKVLVENLSNGSSVVVRINDRGPFVAGRIIDVSKAAASTLGMIGSGVANVRVSALGGGTPEASIPHGAMQVASKATRAAPDAGVRKQVVASFKRAQSRHNRELASVAASTRYAARHRSEGKIIVVASAENTYGVLGRNPSFMEPVSSERLHGSRRGKDRVVLN